MWLSINNEKTSASNMKMTLSISGILYTLLCIVTGYNYPKVEYREYYQRSHYRCKPVFNCQPGFYVKECTLNEGTESCEKCPENQYQPYYVSSIIINDTLRKCYPQKYSCPDDNVRIRENSSSQVCGRPCACDINKCFHGKDPCDCGKRKSKCEKDTYLNQLTGECDKCPLGMYTNSAGCGPCLHNESFYNEKIAASAAATTPKSATTKMSVTETKTTPKTKTSSFSSLPEDVSTKIPGKQVTDENAAEERNTFPFWLIAVILCIVFVLFFVILVVVWVLRRKRHKRHHNALGNEGFELAANERHNSLPSNVNHNQNLVNWNGYSVARNGRRNDTNVPTEQSINSHTHLLSAEEQTNNNDSHSRTISEGQISPRGVIDTLPRFPNQINSSGTNHTVQFDMPGDFQRSTNRPNYSRSESVPVQDTNPHTPPTGSSDSSNPLDFPNSGVISPFPRHFSNPEAGLHLSLQGSVPYQDDRAPISQEPITDNDTRVSDYQTFDRDQCNVKSPVECTDDQYQDVQGGAMNISEEGEQSGRFLAINPDNKAARLPGDGQDSAPTTKKDIDDSLSPEFIRQLSGEDNT